MRSLPEALDQFAYHPATSNTAPKHAAVRDLLADVVRSLWPLLPDGPEKTLAIRKIQECGMYANLAIAMSAPSDMTETRTIARQLPMGTETVTIVDSEKKTPEEIAAELQSALNHMTRRYEAGQ